MALLHRKDVPWTPVGFLAEEATKTFGHSAQAHLGIRCLAPILDRKGRLFSQARETKLLKVYVGECFEVEIRLVREKVIKGNPIVDEAALPENETMPWWREFRNYSGCSQTNDLEVWACSGVGVFSRS